MEKECLCCKKLFYARPSKIKLGKDKFCSLDCCGKFNGPLKVKVHIPNVECAWCKNSFWKKLSSLKLSKSGLYYCCLEHKALAQRFVNGIPEARPKHYGDGRWSYREIAFRNLPNQCARCGFCNPTEILEVNHKDLDHGNSDLSNLEILCPNCHAIFHFKTKTGKWRG